MLGLSAEVPQATWEDRCSRRRAWPDRSAPVVALRELRPVPHLIGPAHGLLLVAPWHCCRHRRRVVRALDADRVRSHIPDAEGDVVRVDGQAGVQRGSPPHGVEVKLELVFRKGQITFHGVGLCAKAVGSLVGPLEVAPLLGDAARGNAAAEILHGHVGIVDAESQSARGVADVVEDRELHIRHASRPAGELCTLDRHIANHQVITIAVVLKLVKVCFEDQITRVWNFWVAGRRHPDHDELSRRGNMELLACDVGQLRVKGGHAAQQLGRRHVHGFQTIDARDASRE
mmetsp:Transcript_126945/g.344664  ORF Transcript_126945/g.344664 Transcript_126945/m.344664 type:complete len:287 (+) Transcript_126945:152-1012(+)